jgi:hypothetical protein
MDCKHENFAAEVVVNRREDTGKVMADVRIWCARCQLPFHFVGVEFGISFYKPMISIMGTELHVPIAPGEIPLDLTGGQFKVQM